MKMWVGDIQIFRVITWEKKLRKERNREKHREEKKKLVIKSKIKRFGPDNVPQKIPFN